MQRPQPTKTVRETVALAVSIPEEGKAVFTYSDIGLDATSWLAINHDTCRLSAVVTCEELCVVVRCTSVSPATSEWLRTADKVVWNRMSGNETMSAMEVDLVHY